MAAKMAELGFTLDASALTIPVADASQPDGAWLNAQTGDLVPGLIEAQFVQPVRWAAAVRQLATATRGKNGSATRVDRIIDVGPGVGVARLVAVALRGSGVMVAAASERVGRDLLLGLAAPGAGKAVNYADFAPRLATLPDGTVVIDNRYTRATGQAPVILGGMTPTTVDVDIVAAAANAGFTAELAGGGQVSEPIFKLRIEELEAKLNPGRDAVLNTLFLDRYLWDMQLGTSRLTQKALAAGRPLRGVTVSAGIPDVEEATQLLRELQRLGAWHNAFKPGTVAQVNQVIAIAEAVPDLTVFMHLEGGKAGGHHSWEDLDELLLSTYHKVRAQPNLVLCVGGGVGDTARGTALLTGAWAEAYGLPRMPVDALIIGTAAMAAAEATTSPQVKQALADARGTDAWVFAGTAEGDVTLGQEPAAGRYPLPGHRRRPLRPPAGHCRW